MATVTNQSRENMKRHTLPNLTTHHEVTEAARRCHCNRQIGHRDRIVRSEIAVQLLRSVGL